MGSRRFWLKVGLGFLALLLSLCGYAGYQAHRLLSEQGIRVDWQALSLSPRGLQLNEFELEQTSEAGHLLVHSQHLRLDWLASTAPRYRLSAQGLQLNWQPVETTVEDAPATDLRQQLQQLADLLPWLPHQIDVQALQAQLPCPSGRCSLEGALQLTYQADELQLRVNLQRDTHLAELQATLGGLALYPKAPLNLQANLHLDGQKELSLTSRLQPLVDAADWSGQLNAQQLGDLDWLGEWLSEWLLVDSSALPATPQQARLDAQWQLRLGDDGWNLATLLDSPGELRLDALLDQPWPVPGIGLLSGTLTLDLRGETGRWQAKQMHGDLKLEPQGAPWLAQVPAGLQPDELQLQIRPATTERTNTDDLTLNLALNSKGPLQLQAEAELQLSQHAAWEVALAQFKLDARSERLRLTDTRASGLQLQLTATGNANAQQMSLALGNGSSFSVARLNASDIELQQLQGELAGLEISGHLPEVSLQGPLSLRVQRLQQAQLHTQAWQWQGILQADTEQQSLNGALLADAGLALALQMSRNDSGDLTLKADLPELFLRAGNPLAQTLANWPTLLSLDNGRLQGNAELRMASGRPLQAQVALNAKGIGGIYDRATLSGIDGNLRLKVEKQRLLLELPSLSAKQIDPGIPLGPLQLQASYQAALSQPLTGKLLHQRAELGVLGGKLSLIAAEWNLDQPSQLLPLQLSGLDLQELFRVYPAEGLEGSGLLDGTLPLRVGQGNLSIEQGRIDARAPGGRLRFHSPRIHAMGQANPGMKLVTDALEDFHYDLLDSSLDYDQSGTLRLGVRLQGQNPAIEQGRPIHFNINLEEDIPTLLASLQLTDKVSEIIQQRIQQRMRQRIPQDAKE